MTFTINYLDYVTFTTCIFKPLQTYAFAAKKKKNQLVIFFIRYWKILTIFLYLKSVIKSLEDQNSGANNPINSNFPTSCHLLPRNYAFNISS